MIKKFLICVSVIVFIFTQVSFFSLTVSAEMPKYSTPNLDDYPDSTEGALAFVSDCFTSVGLNTVSGLCNACIYPLDNTLGTAMEEKFGCNPFDIPSSTFYDCFSDWYLNHGNHTGGGGHRDGSPSLDTDGSYSFNYPDSNSGNTVYLDDGAGGFFTIIDNSHVTLPYTENLDFHVYYRGSEVYSLVGSEDASYHYKGSGNTVKKPVFDYGVYTVPDSSNVCLWICWHYGYEEYIGLTPSSGSITDESVTYPVRFFSYSFSYSDYQYHPTEGTRNIGVYRNYFTVKNYSLPPVNSTTLYSYNPVTNNIENNYFYGADSDGNPCLYDNNNNVYNFNNDGTLGDSHLYLIPDFSTLNDNDLIELTNLLSNFYMSVYINLLQQNNSDNSDILPFLSSMLNQLMGINNNSSAANTWLKSINSSVQQLNSDTNTLLKSINDSIIALGKTPGTSEDNSDIIILLTEIKKGILGDNQPYKPDQIIDLLEQIAKNTAPNPENLDEQPIDFQFDYYVQTVPDMLRERLDVSSYFKQLKNIFGFFFNDDFLSDIDFDEYFNTENYMGSDDSEASLAAVSYSTADYPEVYGEDLAQQDVDITSSVYLTASLYNSGATIEGNTIPAPYLEVNIWGHTYNLFEYLTPEVYDKIKPLKNLISIFLYIIYYLWIVRSVLPSLFSGSNLNFYSTTSDDL